MKKLLVGLSLLASLATTAVLGADVDLTGTKWAGNVELKPGKYQLEVKAGTATFKLGNREVARVLASVELGDQTYGNTMVELKDSHIIAIRLAHSAVRVIFDTQAASESAAALAADATAANSASANSAPSNNEAPTAAHFSIELTAPTRVGAHELKPGQYRLDVKDGVLTFKQARQVVATVPATVEIGSQEYPETMVEAIGARLSAVRVGGSTTRVILDGVEASAMQAAAAAKETSKQQAPEAPAEEKLIAGKVDLTNTLRAGTAVLKPGPYRLEMSGNTLIIKSGKTEVARVPATIQNGSRKFDVTLLESAGAQIASVRLGGTSTTILLNTPELAEAAKAAPAPPESAEPPDAEEARILTANVDFLNPIRVSDNMELKSGRYRVEVKDGQMIIRLGKDEMIQVPVTTETSSQKYSLTSIETAGNKLAAIRIGGSTTRIILLPSAVAIASASK